MSSFFLLTSPPSIFAVFGSICIGLYHLSMLKKKVINPDFEGSWITYFKSMITKKK